MQIEFDETQPTVLVGLGVNPERFKTISDKVLVKGTQINTLVGNVLKDPEITLPEKVALIYELGAQFGQLVLVQKLQQDATEQATQLAHLAQAEVH